MSYEVLYNIWTTRRGHKLGEWKDFIDAVCVPALWPFVEEMDLYGCPYESSGNNKKP